MQGGQIICHQRSGKFTKLVICSVHIAGCLAAPTPDTKTIFARIMLLTHSQAHRTYGYLVDKLKADVSCRHMLLKFISPRHLDFSGQYPF
jgi:hypothetical protein